MQKTPEKKSTVAEVINTAYDIYKVLTWDPLQPAAAQPESTTLTGQVFDMVAPFLPYEAVGGKILSKIIPNAAKPTITATAEYLKLFKPINEYDATKTLYRGTTGSEVGSTALFLTDDAAVAATYVKNGGQVMQYEMTQFSLKSLITTGELELKSGIHGVAGAASTEYKFIGEKLVEAVNSIAKPLQK